MGEDIAERYRALWQELTDPEVITADERYKITEKIQRLNELGFNVDEVYFVPSEGGGRLHMKVKVGVCSITAIFNPVNAAMISAPKRLSKIG